MSIKICYEQVKFDSDLGLKRPQSGQMSHNRDLITLMEKDLDHSLNLSEIIEY